LSACFFDGDNRLKEFFVAVSKVWTIGTSLARRGSSRGAAYAQRNGCDL
jgi:hypothetical protein